MVAAPRGTGSGPLTGGGDSVDFRSRPGASFAGDGAGIPAGFEAGVGDASRGPACGTVPGKPYRFDLWLIRGLIVSGPWTTFPPSMRGTAAASCGAGIGIPCCPGSAAAPGPIPGPKGGVIPAAWGPEGATPGFGDAGGPCFVPGAAVKGATGSPGFPPVMGAAPGGPDIGMLPGAGPGTGTDGVGTFIPGTAAGGKDGPPAFEPGMGAAPGNPGIGGFPEAGTAGD